MIRIGGKPLDEFEAVIEDGEIVLKEKYDGLFHANVVVKRSCPNEGRECFCDGTCKKPLTKDEQIAALERDLMRLKQEKDS